MHDEESNLLEIIIEIPVFVGMTKWKKYYCFLKTFTACRSGLDPESNL